jgi:hypothetical protein
MDKKTLALLCIIALLAGCVYGFWANRTPVIPSLEAQHTSQLTGGMTDTVDTVEARMKEQDIQTRTEVRVIRETVRAKVNALLADDICAGLNAELTLFRGMGTGAFGLDIE